MSKAILIIGFKYDSCVALKNHLIQKYYMDKNLTIALPTSPTDEPTTDAARETYYVGSIYEDWYGWTPTQKYNAYKEARSAADAEYTTAKNTINPYIRKFNAGNNIIVGIPIVELDDDTNAYKLLVSKVPGNSDTSDPNYSERANCASLSITTAEINTFKDLVAALKTDAKPKFYYMNAKSSGTYTVDTVDVTSS